MHKSDIQSLLKRETEDKHEYTLSDTKSRVHGDVITFAESMYAIRGPVSQEEVIPN